MTAVTDNFVLQEYFIYNEESFYDIVIEIQETVPATIDVFREMQDEFENEISLYIHRGHAYEELLEIFMHGVYQKPLKLKMILPNGEEETGVDGGGVFKDALSEFWWTFYQQCNLGCYSKVPNIRHDYDMRKWQAIAAILLKGWKEVKYFPTASLDRSLFYV